MVCWRDENEELCDNICANASSVYYAEERRSQPWEHLLSQVPMDFTNFPDLKSIYLFPPLVDTLFKDPHLLCHEWSVVSFRWLYVYNYILSRQISPFAFEKTLVAVSFPSLLDFSWTRWMSRNLLSTKFLSRKQLNMGCVQRGQQTIFISLASSAASPEARIQPARESLSTTCLQSGRNTNL